MQGKPGSPVHLLVCGLMTLALSFFNYLTEMKKKNGLLVFVWVNEPVS